MIKGGGSRGSSFKFGSRVHATDYPPRGPSTWKPKVFNVVKPASWKGTNYPGGYSTRYTPSPLVRVP